MEDEKDLINETDNKEILEEKSEEENSQEEIKEENTAAETPEAALNDASNNVTQTVEKLSFFNSLTAAVIDTAVISLVSVILLYLIDIVMRNTVGLYITDKVAFLFIIFVVITALYPCLMNAFRGYTVGAGMIQGKRK